MVLLDPHGDLAEDIRKFDLNINPSRLVYVDPFFKKGYTPTINPLQVERKKTDVNFLEIFTQHLVSVFQELLADAKLTNQMRAILTPCIATLLNNYGNSLEDLQQFMRKNKNDRFIEMGRASDIASHRKFFKHQFEESLYDYTKGSIYTKIQSLLNSNTFYNLVTGVSTIDLEKELNKGKLVVFNLAKGKLGEECSVTF